VSNVTLIRVSALNQAKNQANNVAQNQLLKSGEESGEPPEPWPDRPGPEEMLAIDRHPLTRQLNRAFFSCLARWRIEDGAV
jgi:hypothetical protein